MPVSQPPFNADHSRSSWEYELTSSLNTLEGRAKALLDLLANPEALAKIEDILGDYEEVQERLDSSLLFIQDEQPTPVYNDKYMWLQTNVNSDGDFSLWFCDGD